MKARYTKEGNIIITRADYEYHKSIDVMRDEIINGND
jgi:hypothetical protein